MVRRVLGVLCLGILVLFISSCGQTYKLQSISVSPDAPNLEGIGATQALTVTANYSNTKSTTVTTVSTYELGASIDTSSVTGSGLAPLDAVTLSKSGILQAVVSPTLASGACTWHATPTDAKDTTFAYTTNPYPVTITYSENGVTATAYSFVSVDSVGDCYDGTTYVAPTGFPGN